MNLETAENIQCEFEYLALDAYFPMHFASHGQGNKDWQFAVEFIYRLLICQLAILEPVNLETEKDILGFCHKLAKQNPFGKDNGVWYWGEIILTKKGLDLIIKYIPEAFKEWNGKKFELNTPFIKTLESIFIEHGVEWDENNPLFPIASLMHS
jgi:identified by metaGeneAnnotator